MDSSLIRDNIQGVIFGCALGDGAGLATEFMNKPQAYQLYGNGPIKFGLHKGFEFWRDGHRRKWHENDFTDDTDQTLLVAQSILETDGTLISQHFALRLKEWTKIGFPELEGKLACGIGYTVGSCLSHPDFLTNPHQASFQVWDRKRNLAANGAVMRTSVLGIPFFWDEEKVVLNAISCAKVTHADPRSVFSAVVVSVIIARMLRKKVGIPEDFEVSEELKESFLRELESGTSSTSSEPQIDVKPKEVKAVSLTEAEPGPSSFVAKLKAKLGIKKDVSKDDWNISPGWPQHPEPDRKRVENKREITPFPGSMDSFSVDEELHQLVQTVVTTYKFLITGSQLLHPLENKNEDCASKLSHWQEDMEKYCCNLANAKLGDFELDEGGSIGYTFKCLGSALFCFTREVPERMKQAEFFKSLITELTLEAGDADTNCAVAGALLGVRFGYSNLPEEWANGLKHTKFLIRISNDLENLVLTTRKKYVSMQ